MHVFLGSAYDSYQAYIRDIEVYEFLLLLLIRVHVGAQGTDGACQVDTGSLSQIPWGSIGDPPTSNLLSL